MHSLGEYRFLAYVFPRHPPHFNKETGTANSGRGLSNALLNLPGHRLLNVSVITANFGAIHILPFFGRQLLRHSAYGMAYRLIALFLNTMLNV
ncbi:hypothetical protein NB725_004292 [Pantoea ananatis]|nr:hypothetical protein [Pantoea ananatis]MCW0341554.1 hypothetical protein [Pantoea ananatis]MCW0360036.1 hypothetical protein [Pantoea ananatis]MCW0364682.1 hypothetical protein [Pantoea ananatis]